MTTAMQRAIRAAMRAARRMNGVTVTLRRGGIVLKDVRAIVGRTEYEGTDGHGVIVRVETRDYLIAATEYVRLDPRDPLPRAKDCIEEVGTDDVIRSHQVGEPAGGEKCYRFMDQWRGELRVHTIRTNELRP